MPVRDSILARRALWTLNARLPDKAVRRTVQGVDLLLPRRHALPLYACPGSDYGQNLVRLAELVADGDLVLLDIGANVGDSTAQVLAAVPGRAVCVEPDPEWWPYLEANVDDRAALDRSLVLPDVAADGAGLTPVRAGHGTTRFTAGDGDGSAPTTSPDGLLAAHPELAGVRLVKTDTDGFDVGLLPALAKAFAGSRPVLFFEYDVRLTRLAAPGLDPFAVWGDLADLGYDVAAVWHNHGHPLGHAPTSALAAPARTLDPPGTGRGDPSYWDVAVAHRDDPVGQAALRTLAPRPFATS